MQGAKNEAEDYLLKDIELCERQSIQCMIQRKAVGEEKATAEGQKEETKASLSEHRKKLKGSDAEIKALEEKYNSHKAEHEVRARWRRAHTGRTRARGQQRHSPYLTSRAVGVGAADRVQGAGGQQEPVCCVRAQGRQVPRGH